MKRPMTFTWLTVAALATAGVVDAVHAAPYAFDGNGSIGGAWETPANWNPDRTSPAATDDLAVADGSNTANSVTITSAGETIDELVVGTSGGSGYVAQSGGSINIEGGSLTVGSDGTGVYAISAGSLGQVKTTGIRNQIGGDTGSNGTLEISGTANVTMGSALRVGNDGTGTVNMTGGTFTKLITDQASQMGYVSLGGDANYNSGSGTGYWNQSGGHTELQGALVLGAGTSASSGTWTQTGGSTSVMGGTVIGNSNGAAGTLTLADAAQFAAAAGGFTTQQLRNQVQFSVGANGTLVLDGSRTGAGTDLTAHGQLHFDAGSTFEAIIDDAAITDPSLMRKIVLTGNGAGNTADVTFADGALLDVGFDPAATLIPDSGSITWTLMTWEYALDYDGLAFAPSVDTARWSFSTAGNALTVTYTIPEPATIALLSMGMGLVLATPRRRH